MRQLTTAAGVNLAAVNYHFGSKDNLVAEVFRRRMDVMSYARLDQLKRARKHAPGLRIAAARELLEKTNMRMYEVCDAVGYNSVEHFLRTFKRATGQTPLQYRKENVKKHQ